MTELVTILDSAGIPVGSGVTVNSARWKDTGLAVSPTPSVAVSDSATGQWLITATSPATPRGGMNVLLSYDDGVETVVVPVEVEDTRLNASAITDAAFLSTSQARKSIAMLGGKSTWNASTQTATYYAADNSTIVFTDTRSVASGVTTRTVV